MELDKFEKKLLGLLEEEHHKRTNTTIAKCKIKECWFKEMKELIKE